MPNRVVHENPTSNVLAWNVHAANVAALAEEESANDADEPPEERPLGLSPASKRFQKSTLRQKPEAYSSLLTKALQSHSEDDSLDGYTGPRSSRRRRSLTSNISVASTADLTCDTGLTTPARTSSPSPRLPQEGFDSASTIPGQANNGAAVVTTELPKEEKKRCISFACAGVPPRRPTVVIAAKPVVPNNAPKKPCIKFACAGRPANAPAAVPVPREPTTAASNGLAPPNSRKYRSPSVHSRSARSVTPKRSSKSPLAVRFRNYLTADSKDLQAEGVRFHEFATDEVQEDDWIRQDQSNAQQRRLTIDDTLKMEMAIRRLGKEAEEEAEEEEAEDQDEADVEAADEGDDDLDTIDEDNAADYDDFEDDQSGYGSDHDSSEGYRTDEEIGFAESDDDEDDELVLWSTGGLSSGTIAIESLQRRASIGDLSDSSAFSPGHVTSGRSRMPRSPRPARRLGTPELPDSTDFVCGTLDEDRPLEEAYMSCIAAKRKEKLRLIPQDIDPSFPTSEPEDDDESFKPLHRNSDEHVWLHGELEDLDLDDDPVDRRSKKTESPKRLHSPPPRRHHSPPPKARGRSPPPRRLVDRQSPPRRLRSPPPPQTTAFPRMSPLNGGQSDAFKTLALRPGLTHTKSLPRRAPAIFMHLKMQSQRKKSVAAPREKHVRGAIDIVKGLEQRRQRRREKFKEKQCNRARKGLTHEKRPQPGKGAERMRELGLLMAGKIGPGHYVISV